MTNERTTARARRGPAAILGLLVVAAIPRLVAAAAPAAPVPAATARPPAGTVAPALPATGEAEPADLIVANRPIVTLRAVNFGITPRLRVAIASGRIRDLLADAYPGEVNTQVLPEGIVFRIGHEPLFRLTDGDRVADSGESLEDVRVAVLARLSQAVAEERELRSLTAILRHAGKVALATLLFATVLLLLRFAARRAAGALTGRLDRRIGSFQVKGRTVLTRDQLALLATRPVMLLKWILILSGTYLWLAYSLTQFPVTRPWGERLGRHLFEAAGAAIEAFVAALPNLTIVVLIFLGTRFVARSIGSLFRSIGDGEASVGGIHPDTAQATRRITVCIVWILGMALAYPFLPGSNSDAFKGIGFFVGLIMSFGSAGLVGQAMAGFIIVYARQFRPGDYVRIGDTEGIVQNVGIFATKLRTYRQEEVSLPNSVVLAVVTRNYSRPTDARGVVLSTTVGIGYDAPWRQVHAMLIEAAGRTPGLRRDPAPFVLQMSLGDFFVEYQLNAWLEVPTDRYRVLALLHASIQDAFNEHGVQIMSPHYEGDPGKPKVVPRSQWHAAPAKPDLPERRA